MESKSSPCHSTAKILQSNSRAKLDQQTPSKENTVTTSVEETLIEPKTSTSNNTYTAEDVCVVNNILTVNNNSNRRNKMQNGHFNSISEQSIDSTEYDTNDLTSQTQQAPTVVLNNNSVTKNFWKSQTGLKKRLSLKIIKKRDSFISKLEEDQKFLNK